MSFDPDGHHGRLELTWTNKDKTLLADEDGGYRWVDPADFRVAEVRLLSDVATVGEVGVKRAADNLLIRGDALHALLSLNRLPEFAAEYVGKVRLVYIDPPFNTGQAFAHYDDNLEHSVWLTMLRDRLTQIKPLLTPTGTVWVHLDDVEHHRCRLVLDEVFGQDNFQGTVVWEKTDSPRMDASGFSVRHDSILVYGRGPGATLNWLPTNKTHAKKVDAEGRRYYLNPLRARGGQGSTREARPTLYYSITAPDGTEVYPKLPDGGDGAWRWSREKLERESHLIEWIDGRNGWTPNYRIYESDTPTRPPETLWLHTEVGSTRTSANEIKALFSGKAFSTPKPERLMQRILQVATDPGDIVLDCFAGSGTTAAVAHKMGRRWITVERDENTVATFTLPRLQKVVSGEDQGGISTVEVPVGEGLPEAVKGGEPKAAAKTLLAMLEAGHLDVDEKTVKDLAKQLRAADKVKVEQLWAGGGGFRVLDVGPSMFEEVDGRIYLAEWATGSALAEPVAAQYGFQYESDDPPFAGRKGRVRLAVIDGLVNDAVIRLLVSALPENERLSVCGTAIDPEARVVLKELRPGSTLKRVPAAILDEYRQSRREWLRLASVLDWQEATALLAEDSSSDPVKA